jgi:hypothetical protein
MVSEPRAAHNTTMQPGRELDALVARVIGWNGVSWTGESPAYSTDPAAAMQAWAWLEENNPWKRPDTIAFALTRDDDGRPSVLHIYGYDEYETITTGNDYPHVIALAVVKAGKALGVIE